MLNLDLGAKFVPHVRWSSQANAFMCTDDDGEKVEIKLTKTVFDLPNLKTGWARFTKNEAPHWQIDASIS